MPEQPSFDGDADDVIEMAVAEMGKRLVANPDDLPAHVLIKLVSEGNKVQERREEKARREASEEAQKSVLQVVRESSLPASRKRQIIETELARLREQIKELEAELDER